jgi:hypothetical protein
MKPADVALAFEQFKKQVETLKGDDLLDRWIAFNGSAESKEPDLGLMKDMCLEALLQREFGFSWRKAADARRRSGSDA